MITLSDLLTRLQSQATGCIAVLLVDLRDGTVAESCGDDASAGTVARVMRDLVAPQHVILPQIPVAAGAGVPNETIVVSDNHTFVCRRLEDPPHHAVTTICRGTRSLGLVVGLLHDALVPKDAR
jgi:hypothetical protein